MRPAASTATANAAATGQPALYNRGAALLKRLISHDLLALAARFGIAGFF
jgi:hypothetical protein